MDVSVIKEMPKAGLNERAWWLIRRRKSVTVKEVLSVVSDGSQKTASYMLSRYFKALTNAGILTAERRGYGRTLHYHLARNVGAVAPKWQRSQKQVYDPNNQQVYPLGEDHES